MKNNITFSHRSQAENPAQPENLKDKTSSGRQRPWQPKKVDSLNLAESYRRLFGRHGLLNYQKDAFKIEHCGELLIFKQSNKDGSLKLYKANFCKHRLCPMCAWRKSLKNYGIASQVMEVARGEGYRFVFLTLTLQNVPGYKLKGEITRFLQAWNLLQKDRTVKKAVQGWIRTIEVTRNSKKGSKWYGTYNPHIHAILAVRPGYFKGGNYINHQRWTELWKSKVGVDYDPIINVQTVNAKKSKSQTIEGAIKEISNYTIKSRDMLGKGLSEDETDEIVATLDDALFGRRLTAYGGRLKKIKAQLNVNEKDLVNIEGEPEIDEELGYVLVKYAWSHAHNDYVKVA